MLSLPFGVIEQILRLVNNLLEARPVEQREAEARIWFAVWWPLVRIGLKPEQVTQIEKLMEVNRRDIGA